jgi:hypothetical protein
LSREGSLSCHTYCDTGPRFFLSHPKDHHNQLPLTTRMGMQRTYSNPDPHGAPLCMHVKLILGPMYRSSARYMSMYAYIGQPVRIRVRIGTSHQRVTVSVLQLVWHGKNPFCSKALSAEHRTKFCSLSPVKVTSPCK